jgi:hypothetical protein
MATIRGLVARTRSRLRVQGALEGATTASIVAVAGALATIYGLRTEALSQGVAIGLFGACAATVALGAALGAIRRHEDEQVARRIDRASDLADRLSTAVAFEQSLRTGVPVLAADLDPDVDPDETRALMEAAIRDAVRAAPRANVTAAAPFALPRDARAAGGFAVVAALVAGLAIPTTDHTPRLVAADPDRGPPGAHVVLRGVNLRTGVLDHASIGLARAVGNTIGAAGVDAPAPTPEVEHTGLIVTLGRAEGAMAVRVLDWQATAITIEIPRDAAPGDTELSATLGDQVLGPIKFRVIDPKDATYHAADSVAFTDDERDYIKTLIEQIKQIAKDEASEDLSDYAAKLEKMMEKAERGELTKEQLMAAMKQAEDQLKANQEPAPADVSKDLSETGKELAKTPLTKELGEALEKGDLAKAQEQLDKLADKLDKGELSPKDKEDVAKAMDKAAKAFDQKDQQKDKDQDAQQQKARDEIKELERKLQDPKTQKNPKDKADNERRLDEKKKELKRLEKNKEDQQQSEQHRALKRLHKDMEKTAESLSKKPDPKDGDQKQQDQQASRNLRDVSRETGKVDRDQRRTSAQKKAASQMEDLREALRRAKQRGSKGPQDPFNRNGKESDFAKRAGGGKGDGKAWKPGQGQGQGQGQGGQGQGKGQGKGPGQNGGNGTDPDGPSDTYGTGHDPNMTGDQTAMSGNDKDQSVTGVQGKGTSKRETILAAAQKGFASTQYKKVYADYAKVIENVLHSEEVPAAYKYYVKKYFNRIKPHEMPTADADAPVAQPAAPAHP